ncbi:hypothetical protein C7474_2922 [Microbacterium telephonicum]|uniref:Uncharacterized protein n=1 Tax=Microbacterium telephonicum TaxID=1714841 RepID=A0A498BV38_9MICO|nr:hypothetical protein C7474_2922 [Microbacterium telephonicum]
MYRRRRLAVLLAVLLVVGGGVALAVWQPWNGVGAAAPRTTTSASGSGVPTSPAASTPSASPSATADAAPTDPAETPAPAEPTEPEAAEITQCETRSLAVTAVTDKESYGSGELPQLSITLANTGADPCLIDVGTATQSFTITSGSDTWWRSTDCQSESGNQVVQLAAGQTVSSAAPLSWDRTRSSVDTCGGNRPGALPGYYNLTVTIGGVLSQPVQFRLR